MLLHHHDVDQASKRADVRRVAWVERQSLGAGRCDDQQINDRCPAGFASRRGDRSVDPAEGHSWRIQIPRSMPIASTSARA